MNELPGGKGGRESLEKGENSGSKAELPSADMAQGENDGASSGDESGRNLVREYGVSAKRVAENAEADTGESGKRSRKVTKLKGLPTRPLSAYNIFFREERVRWLDEQKTGARPSQKDCVDDKKEPGTFRGMAKAIGKRWRELTDDERVQYEVIAKEDMKRYRREMEEYKDKLLQEVKEGSSEAPQNWPAVGLSLPSEQRGIYGLHTEAHSSARKSPPMPLNEQMIQESQFQADSGQHNHQDNIIQRQGERPLLQHSFQPSFLGHHAHRSLQHDQHTQQRHAASFTGSSVHESSNTALNSALASLLQLQQQQEPFPSSLLEAQLQLQLRQQQQQQQQLQNLYLGQALGNQLSGSVAQSWANNDYFDRQMAASEASVLLRQLQETRLLTHQIEVARRTFGSVPLPSQSWPTNLQSQLQAILPGRTLAELTPEQRIHLQLLLQQEQARQRDQSNPPHGGSTG